jgi:formylglycine-generating enzyme required for sulfatase activity
VSQDVFFSYRRSDEVAVQQIYDDLLLRGVTSIWMDKRALEPGDIWKSEITQAIDRCSHLVLFISEDTLTSPEVEYEYTRAYQQDKIIIPLLLESISATELPEIVRKFNWIELPKADIEAKSSRYLHSLAKLVKSGLPRVKYILPEMVHIPSGICTIGGPGETLKIDLAEFWLSRIPITVVEYMCFVEASGFEVPEYWAGDSLQEWLAGPGSTTWPSAHLKDYSLERPLQPMRGISWYEAMAYCKWLSYIVEHPFTLPSEAQWEKAARGTDKRLWAFGNSWNSSAADVMEHDDRRDYPKDCGIVGSDSPYGCQDMVGGVWNWTLSKDLFLPYYEDGRAEQLQDLHEPRIIRGGSWKHYSAKAYTYHRESQMPIPEDYRFDIGFRLSTNEDPLSLTPYTL